MWKTEWGEINLVWSLIYSIVPKGHKETPESSQWRLLSIDKVLPSVLLRMNLKISRLEEVHFCGGDG